MSPLDLNSSNLDKSDFSSFVLHLSFSNVDFCVWLLELDGLQVSPFDRHLDGNRVLRDNAMNSESWRSWVEKIALVSDQRLNWNLKVEELEKYKSKAEIDWLKKHYLANMPTIYRDWQQQQYEKAVSAAMRVFSNYEPSELIKLRHAPVTQFGNWEPAMQTIMEELLKHYRTKVFRDREKLWQIPEGGGSQGKRLWDTLQPYHDELPALELHLVAYERPVEHLVPPASVILSMSDDPSSNNSDIFQERVLQAAANLVIMNRQSNL